MDIKPSPPKQTPPVNTINQPEQTAPEVLSSPPVTKRKRWPILIMASLLFVALAAAATWWFLLKPSAPSSQEQTYSGTTEDITIANVGEYSIFNLIAKEKGFFEQNGLNATVKEYEAGPPAVTDLLASKANFAVAADFVGVNNMFANPDLRILSQGSQQDNFEIIALKSKGINKPEDLRGKTIAVTKKGAGEFFLVRYLGLHGMKTKDVTIVDSIPPDMNEQIAAAEVDAIVTFGPHVYNNKQKLADKANFWSVQGNLKTAALVYSTRGYISAHPDTVKRYLSALTQAETFLNENDQEARDILAETMKYDKAYVDYFWPKIDFGLRLDQELVLNLEDEARFVIENKGTTQTKVPNYLDYIYFTGLKEAKPDAVKLIH